LNISIEVSGTFEPNEPAFTEFIDHFFAIQKQSFDEDGGMHTAGVQMMLAYDEGQFTVEELMMPA